MALTPSRSSWPFNGPPTPQFTKKALSNTRSALNSVKNELDTITTNGTDLAKRAGFEDTEALAVVTSYDQAMAAYDVATNKAKSLSDQLEKSFGLVNGAIADMGGITELSTAIPDKIPSDLIVVLYTLVIKLSGNLDVIRGISAEHKAMLWNEEIARGHQIPNKTMTKVHQKVQRILEEDDENRHQRHSSLIPDDDETAKNVAKLKRDLQKARNGYEKVSHDMGEMEAKIMELEEQITELKVDKTKVEAENAELFKAAQNCEPELRKEIEDLRLILDNKEILAQQYTIDADKKEYLEMKRWREKEEDYDAQFSNMDSYINNLKKTVRSLEKDKKIRDMDSAEANRQVRELSRELRGLKDDHKALIESSNSCVKENKGLVELVTSLQAKLAGSPQVEKLQERLQNVNDNARQVDDERKRLLQSEKELKQKLSQSEYSNNSLKGQLASLKMEPVNDPGLTEGLQDRVKELEAMLDACAIEKQELSNQNFTLATNNAGLKESIQASRLEMDSLRTEQVESAAKAAEAQGRVDEIRKQVEGLQNDKAALVEEQTRLSVRNNSLASDVQRLNSEVEDFHKRDVEHSATIDMLNSKVSQVELDSSSIRRTAEEFQKKYKEAETSLTQVTADYAEAVDKLQATEVEMNSRPLPADHAKVLDKLKAAEAEIDSRPSATKHAEVLEMLRVAQEEANSRPLPADYARVLDKLKAAEAEIDSRPSATKHAEVLEMLRVAQEQVNSRPLPPEYTDDAVQVDDARERLDGWRVWALHMMVPGTATLDQRVEWAAWRDMINSVENGMVSSQSVERAISFPANTWPMIEPWCNSNGVSYKQQSVQVSIWELYSLFLTGTTISSYGFSLLRQIYQARKYTPPEADDEFLSRYITAVLEKDEEPSLGTAIFTIGIFQYVEDIMRHSWPHRAKMYDEKRDILEAYIMAKAPELLREWFKAVKTRDVEIIKSFCLSNGLIVKQGSLGIISGPTISWTIFVNLDNHSWVVSQCWRGTLKSVDEFFVDPPSNRGLEPFAVDLLSDDEFTWLFQSYVRGTKPPKPMQRD